MVKSKFYIGEKDKELFYKSFLCLESEASVRNYLRDLLTEGEIDDFASRFLIARMIYDGRSYDDIQKATKRSTTTIARVSKWVKNGKKGYSNIISKLLKK